MKLNLELLQEVGTKVKYATLCELFGVKPSTGNTKIKQMKEFERYMELRKEGTWFHIVEVYNAPKEKEENRGRKAEIDLTDALLCAIYMNQYTQLEDDKLVIGISKNMLYNTIGLCNANYRKIKIANAESMEINTRTHQDFFRSTSSTFSSLVESNLRQLEKQHLIVWKETQIWYSECPDGNSVRRQYHLCSDGELLTIQNARYEAIEQWNAEHPDYTPLAHYGEASFKLMPYDKAKLDLSISKIIRKTLPAYMGSYNCYKICFNKRIIAKELDKRGYSTEIEMELLKEFQMLVSSINEKSVVKVLKANESRYEKSVKATKTNTRVNRTVAKKPSKSQESRVGDTTYLDSCNRLTYASVSQIRMFDDVIICGVISEFED